MISHVDSSHGLANSMARISLSLICYWKLLSEMFPVSSCIVCGLYIDFHDVQLFCNTYAFNESSGFLYFVKYKAGTQNTCP